MKTDSESGDQMVSLWSLCTHIQNKSSRWNDLRAVTLTACVIIGCVMYYSYKPRPQHKPLKAWWVLFCFFHRVLLIQLLFVLHSQAVAVMQQQPVPPTPPPVASEPHSLNLAPAAPPTDPLVRKQVVQDLMAQMQGTYNFMQVRRSRAADDRAVVYCRCDGSRWPRLCSQDSMLEFDGQPIDPAIVSAQPMKPAQNMDLPQMVCPPGELLIGKLSSDTN